jgi:hypothetical protein
MLKKNMKELIKKFTEVGERFEIEQVKFNKTKQELDSISEQIKELKEIQDYGSFKFIHQNMGIIIQKVAPKHKIPEDKEITIPSQSGTSIIASIPWTEEKCSDENPCNINVCPRCTLIHFKSVLDRLLAEYYSK